MPARRMSRFFAIAATLLALGSTQASAADVVVAGDSWAAFGYSQLASTFPAGVSVADAGVPGMTAQGAADTNYVNNAVALNLGATHIYLSLGGNDVIGAYAGGNGGAAASIVDTQLRRVLDQLFAQFPNVKVVLPGYDFPNFEKDTSCQLQGLAIFGNPLAAAINPIFIATIRDVQANVAASYPNVTAVDEFGTLQKAGGVAFPPNLFVPSPSQYMGGNGDCIHANSRGYDLFMGEIYTDYFKAFYGPGGGCATIVDGSGSAPLDRVAILALPLGYVAIRRRRVRRLAV